MDTNMRQAVGQGIFYVFLGEILVFLAFIPVLGLVATLAAGAFSIYGFYTLSKLHEGYRTAFLIIIVNFILQLFNMLFVSETGFLATACGFISMFFSVMVIYYVCSTTSELLQGWDNEVARLGENVWRGIMFSTAVYMVCTVLSMIPLIGILVMIVAAVVGIAQIVINILYLIFLWRSQKVLRMNV